MKPLYFSHFTAVSCAGVGLQQTLLALLNGQNGLSSPSRFLPAGLDSWIGEVPGVDDIVLPAGLNEFNCRNNRLAELGLRQDRFEEAVDMLRIRYGAQRIGVFLGTSTSGILQTELAYRRRDPLSGALPADFVYHGTHNSFSLSAYVRARLGLSGPACVVSTACSSSAKVFASAQRMIASGMIDAAVVGGVDSLCLTTLHGFNSLELLSPEPCRPFDPQRSGISIGEAAVFGLLTRAGDEPLSHADAVKLLGAGESSDAYHMSSPHPDGRGARLAMEAALNSAGLTAAEIDYINLHGTATLSNDAAEGKAVYSLFGGATPCSSTKGMTGHTLGAAGALEAVVCALALRHGVMPGSPNTRKALSDPPLNYLLTSRKQPFLRALSNSFGFGGSNCCLIFSAHD
ncbi:beta-ketoacyl-[acyl-carrier-protein] synthase family protein [Candidatus Methylospira mobilis]|uniref:Beta-ketoacyl-[acyl-carrier-protein] synthase family protein n=1 Tax=Candidatus Methylospira mobilis TaxID=1808979 RepID=A0A5Q0BQ35_9GAMM|nr:beta-ketoacyl-[acyl-carrier-protein] synthase family protein [Candidatus Methylospira mobilis]QFY44197.1 beta-ketoacyl-[acyl-carrier-protein] synthase family protein [Candidatus Methylospira mobilis]WNV06377.1 beta-ketoacyl-[acyl-carrier-protein] synthase family protein [Candidatus Methylospira mobilis]